MKPISIPDISLGAIAPEITLTVVALTLLMAEVFADKKGRDNLGYIALGGVALAGYFTYALKGAHFATFGGLYMVDDFSTFFKLIFTLAAGLSILISIKYGKDEGIDHGEYYAMLLFTTLGMFVMASGEDLITIFMGLEVMSISLYVLAGISRGRAISNEAAIKYFILGAFSSGILLYGMALIYGATGATGLSAIGSAVAGNLGGNVMLSVGIVFVMVGFAFKVAAVPFHMWTPDVYQGAPAPVAAFMSAGPKAAAFAAFIRILIEAFPAMRGHWYEIVWVLAVVTMTVGNMAALNQENVKRMLAYSSISHAGYILVGLAVGTEQAQSSMLFYLLVYTFMNIGAFAVLSVVAGKNEERTSYSDFTGLGYKSPVMALVLSIMIFSLAGIPPMAGFMGKFYIFMSAINEGFIYLAIIGVLNSVVSVFYYLKLTVYMYMRGEGETTAPAITFSPSMAVALALSVYGVIWLGVNPGAYIEMARAAFLSFQ
ncbi:MAG: NADH-quinone oxidoreductase subunit N [Nitrospinae bacterium]|nr:NADH-quinone oxidoreductase subunit N [Nitrospinota bacterium]